MFVLNEVLKFQGTYDTPGLINHINKQLKCKVLNLNQVWPNFSLPSAAVEGSEDVNEFIPKYEEYIVFNGISDKNEYLVVKFSLKADTLLWLENIGTFSVTDEAQRYNKTVNGSRTENSFLVSIKVCFSLYIVS